MKKGNNDNGDSRITGMSVYHIKNHFDQIKDRFDNNVVKRLYHAVPPMTEAR